MKAATALTKCSEAMGCLDGMLMSWRKFFVLEIPCDEALLWSQYLEKKLRAPNDLRTSSFAHIHNRNRISDLNMPLSVSRHENGSDPVPSYFFYLRTKSSLAFADRQNLTEPWGFYCHIQGPSKQQDGGQGIQTYWVSFPDVPPS